MLNLIAASAYFLLIHFGVSGTRLEILREGQSREAIVRLEAVQ